MFVSCLFYERLECKLVSHLSISFRTGFLGGGDLVLMPKQNDVLETELIFSFQCVLPTLLCTWHILSVQETVVQ